MAQLDPHARTCAPRGFRAIERVMAIVQITHTDRELQRAFCAYVPQVFRRASFQTWTDWGEWGPDYRAFAWVEEGQVLANASLTRMRLLLDGRPQLGFQLGAVGCVPEHRQSGLTRRCLEAALGSCGSSPVLLFANPQVLEFYSRFGFQPYPQSRFAASHVAGPAVVRAMPRDPRDPAVRNQLRRLLLEGVVVSNRFGARGYGETLSWYVANGLTRQLHQLADELFVIAGIEQDVLCIDDILAREMTDLKPWLGQLLDRPITRIHFGFTPERWWPQAQPIGADTQAHLFVRGFVAGLPNLPNRFPVLART